MTVIPRANGVSSTLRLFDSITDASEYWVARWSLSSGGHSADPLAGDDGLRVWRAMTSKRTFTSSPRNAPEFLIISPDIVRAAAPDVILTSWCGKNVVVDKIRKRPGWNEIPAIRHDRIIEIKSPLILQPGPAALTDGLDATVAALWPALPSS